MQHSTFNFSTNKQPSTINPTSLKLRGASHQPSTNNYQPFPVDFCSFAAVLFHRSIFEKVGLLDEKNFFMYYEDMDLCLRMKQEGIPILFVPEIKTDHRGSGSSDREPEKKRQYYETSRKNYLLKHRGWLVYLLNAFGFLK